MNIISHASDLKSGPRKTCVAIGMFDGVHLGHQQVIRQTIEDARQHEGIAVAMTFDCHPNSVVAPERNPPLIYSLSQRLRVIESLGIDVALSIHFDQAFSEITGEQFIRALARDFRNLHSLCVGSAFTFGHRRSGNIGRSLILASVQRCKTPHGNSKSKSTCSISLATFTIRNWELRLWENYARNTGFLLAKRCESKSSGTLRRRTPCSDNAKLPGS